MQQQTFTDPATGRQYTVDPTTGQSRWLGAPPPAPSGGPVPPVPPAQFPGGYGTPQPASPGKGSGKALKIGGAIVGVLVVFGIIGSCSGNDATTATTAASSETTTASSSSKAQKPSSRPAATKAAPAVAKIGTPVRDGKFEFTVTSTKTTKKVGSDYLNKTAQGQFLLVSVTVRNIGNKAQMFDSSSQKLFDTDGREYSADGGAGIYLGDANSFLNTINPGNSVKGIVVFDVPMGANLDRVELHDSMFSGGVEVKLAK